MKTIFKKTIMMITAGLFLSMNINAKDNENPKSILISDASKTIKEHIKFQNLLMKGLLCNKIIIMELLLEMVLK